MDEKRKGQRRRAQRRQDIQAAKIYLGMNRRLNERRRTDRRQSTASSAKV